MASFFFLIKLKETAELTSKIDNFFFFFDDICFLFIFKTIMLELKNCNLDIYVFGDKKKKKRKER